MPAKKILIIAPAWVGDMVMAQCLFKTIKQQQPDAMIDVLAPTWGRALLERMPEINKSHLLPFAHGELKLKKRWQIGVELRQENYDQAIVLPNSWKSALVPFAARIPIRTGWMREMRYGLLNDIRYLNKENLPLMIQRFIALGLPKHRPLPQKLPKPSLTVLSAAINNTRAKFNLTAVSRPILILCPGAEFGPAKRWPATHYAKIAQAKLNEGWLVCLLGSPKDQSVALAIQQAVNHACMDLTGQTSLGEAIDLLSLATLVVSNDSGLMHIAAALEKPLVVVYGSSSPRFTPPLNERVKIISLALPCSPCFQRECPLGHLKCLNDLSPDLVLQAIHDLMPV
jgi:heptosyltransferase-2